MLSLETHNPFPSMQKFLGKKLKLTKINRQRAKSLTRGRLILMKPVGTHLDTYLDTKIGAYL